MALKWPDKDPEEILDYPVDFSDWLVTGAQIDDSPVVTVTQVGVSDPGGLVDLVVSQIQMANPNVVVWLTGGTNGEKYTFKIKGTDNQSPQRTYVRRVVIKVKQK